MKGMVSKNFQLKYLLACSIGALTAIFTFASYAQTMYVGPPFTVLCVLSSYCLEEGSNTSRLYANTQSEAIRKADHDWESRPRGIASNRDMYFDHGSGAWLDCEYERTASISAAVVVAPAQPQPSVILYQSPHLVAGSGYCYGFEYRISGSGDTTHSGQKLGTPSCDVNSLCGNPIDVASGNKLQVEKDASAPAIPFVRYYNSFQYAVDKFMGKGWTHSYDYKVEYVESSTSPYVLAYEPDGKYSTFLKDQNGVWINATYPGDILEEVINSNGENAGWRHTARDGKSVEIYDSLGRLSEIQYPDRSRSLAIHYKSDVVASNHDSERVDLVLDQRGRWLSFSYDSAGWLSNVTESGGATYGYAHNAAGNLIGVTYPGGASKQYIYSEPDFDLYAKSDHNLTGIIDESDQRFATFKFDSDRAFSTEHSGLERYVVEYGGRLEGTKIITPLGDKQTRVFEVAKGVKKANSIRDFVCSEGSCRTISKSYSFDSNGRLDTEIDARGFLTDHDYDSRGLETRRVEASNDGAGRKRTVQTDWQSDFRRPVERRTYDASNVLVAKTGWIHDSSGQVLTSTKSDPATSAVRTTTMTYCEQADVTAGSCPLVGLVTSVNGPRTDVADTTSYTYYASDDASCATAPTTCPHRKGDLWQVTNALGQVTETLAYDGAGRVLSVKDPNGVITDLEYHPRGWLTARKTRGVNASVETDDAITRVEYWPTGLVKKVIQPDGAFTLYTYDAAHRLTDIADNAGNTIHYTLDNAGNRTQEDTKDPGNVLKRTLSRVYNQLGQLQTQADAQANPTDFAYDANGNTDTVTDALGRVTDNDYDPLNRLSRTLQNVGGINAETKFVYDAQDNLTQVTDPKGLNTNYIYNGLGDLTQLVSPDTGTTIYTYDSAGNRKTQTDARNQTSTYSYDALNRLTGIAYATSSLDVAYTYDATQAACDTGETFSTGRLTQLTDASGTTQYCYDRFGHLVRKVQTTNGIAFTVRYAYTLAGQLSSVTYPDGATASYVRDAQGRTTQVNVQRAGAATEVLLNQASYHPFGPVAGWTYGNGRQLLRPLNQNYQPTAVQDASAGGLSVGFAYDPVGNLTQLTPAASATPLVKFDYDALSRLTTFKDGPTDVAIESYAYDATGNRQSFTNSAGTQAYTYPATSHRLTQVGATVRSYDNVGNTTAIGGIAKEFVYDDTGRMNQVMQNAVVQMNYVYNGKGEQVRKHLGTTNTYTVYDEAGHWLGDYDSTGATLQQAIWLDDLPVGLIANGNQLHYVEPDHLGTPRAVIEVARNVPVWTWDLKSEAFGNSVPNQDADGDANPLVFDMRFPGQQYDTDTGLNYNYFRDYDTGTGRYVESDPIGLDGGISSYAYGYSQPTMMVDPVGLQAGAATATGSGYIPPGAVGGAGAYNPNDPNNVSPNLPGQFNGWAGQEISLARAANSLLWQSQLLSLTAAISNVCDTKGDDCAELLRKIEIAKNGLARRFRQIAENAGQIDQATHWSQLRQRQVNLRKLLNEATSKGCIIPTDAWYWATR